MTDAPFPAPERGREGGATDAGGGAVSPHIPLATPIRHRPRRSFVDAFPFRP